MRIANTALIVIFCALISACGSGSSSSSSSNTSSNASNNTPDSSSDSSTAPTQNTAASVAENYQAVTIGSPSDFNNSVTIASLWKKVYQNLAWKNLQIIPTAHAVSSCTAPSRLVGAKSNATWEALALSTLDPSTDSTIDDGDSSECITGIQDGAKYIVFVASNLSNNDGKCEINFLNKSNSKIYCLNTKIPNILGASGSRAYARYQVGARDTTLYGVGYTGDYGMNSNGFKAVITRNGKYLFAPFTITVSNRNYVGITRFSLSGGNSPEAKVVWLKEQIVTNNSGITSTSNYIRGFLGLETGDIIVDYLNEYGQQPNIRPIEAAYRYYVAVDSSISNPANQPGFMLWQGNGNYWDPSFNPAGVLFDYLANNDPTNSTDTSGNRTASYAPGLNSQLQSIASDPSSNSRSIVVKLVSANNSRAGARMDLVKVNISVTNGQAGISGVTSLGTTNSDYPIAVVGDKIYSWARNGSYQVVGGSSRSFPSGIYSHPLSGNARSEDTLVYQAGNTFTYRTYATRNSFFVLEGFWGYFGGNLQGTNYIYQLKQANNGSESVSNINIGQIASGLYTIKTLTTNPITDQLQVSGSKKASMSDYSDTTQWSAFISKAGVKQLRVYSTLNALADDKPVLSLKDENGSSVNYASTY